MRIILFCKNANISNYKYYYLSFINLWDLNKLQRTRSMSKILMSVNEP